MVITPVAGLQTTGTPETDSSLCEPSSSDPEFQRVLLSSPESTLEAGETGTVTAALVTDPENSCDVSVQMSLMVPPEMGLSASGDVSTAAGIATTTVSLAPGEYHQFTATVDPNGAGEWTVTSSFTYYPDGYPDQAREINHQRITFDVQERTASPTPTDSTALWGQPDRTTQAVLGSAVVGLLVLVGLRLW